CRRGVFILLLGAPGSGKGTQGKILAERLGLPKITTGDILRAAVKTGSPLGRQAQRSEEHTSELQSRFDLVCRLLLEKKNTYERVLSFLFGEKEKVANQAKLRKGM